MFKIDFFELCFLAQTCIPPVPIARTVFWHKLIDEYYHQLSQRQRDELFNWMRDESKYQMSFADGNKDVKIFDARYDPNNQYLLTCVPPKSEDKPQEIEAFYYNERHHTAINTTIIEDYIIDIKHLGDEY